jgi:hypothetical protein
VNWQNIKDDLYAHQYQILWRGAISLALVLSIALFTLSVGLGFHAYSAGPGVAITLATMLVTLAVCIGVMTHPYTIRLATGLAYRYEFVLDLKKYSEFEFFEFAACNGIKYELVEKTNARTHPRHLSRIGSSAGSSNRIPYGVTRLEHLMLLQMRF